MTEGKTKLEELCNDKKEQNILCPNCKKTHHVFFNPYYEDGVYMCSACNFVTASWQFDVVWK